MIHDMLMPFCRKPSTSVQVLLGRHGVGNLPNVDPWGFAGRRI